MGWALPTISNLWRRNWTQAIPFFAFPAEIRKVIYTTNAVESLNMSLRKAIETRGAFPSEDAALKVIFLALRNLIAKWETVQFWKSAPSRFALLWDDRIQAVRAHRMCPPSPFLSWVRPAPAAVKAKPWRARCARP